MRWSLQDVPFLFLFDDPTRIERFFHTIRLRDMWDATFDIITIPLTNVFRSSQNFPFLELTLYDVKYPKYFGDFVSHLPDLALKNKGTLIASTNQLTIHAGSRLPNYIVSTQWANKEDFQHYLKETEELLNGEQYACTVRVLFLLSQYPRTTSL
ncbi:unnamed protein product [Dicrocoelium dendriticum]|nr:unnamed protein product [Dicrocoelium dendriticum]